MTDKIATLYDPEVHNWSSIEELNDAFDWTELISKTGAEYPKAMPSPRSLRVRQSKLGHALIMPRFADCGLVTALRPNAYFTEY
jgi:hypothetical protein